MFGPIENCVSAENVSRLVRTYFRRLESVEPTLVRNPRLGSVNPEFAYAGEILLAALFDLGVIPEDRLLCKEEIGVLIGMAVGHSMARGIVLPTPACPYLEMEEDGTAA